MKGHCGRILASPGLSVDNYDDSFRGLRPTIDPCLSDPYLTWVASGRSGVMVF